MVLLLCVRDRFAIRFCCMCRSANSCMDLKQQNAYRPPAKRSKTSKPQDAVLIYIAAQYSLNLARLLFNVEGALAIYLTR